MLGEGEQRDAEIRKDEIFGQKVERLEKLLRSLLRFEREVPGKVLVELEPERAWARAQRPRPYVEPALGKTTT